MYIRICIYTHTLKNIYIKFSLCLEKSVKLNYSAILIKNLFIQYFNSKISVVWFNKLGHSVIQRGLGIYRENGYAVYYKLKNKL